MAESTARAERYNLQSLSTPAFTWEVPNKPVCVRMPFTLIDRMEQEVVENFRSLTALGSEIGGILLGVAAPGSPIVVSIDDYEVIPCDYSRGPLYRLSDADMGRFERVIEQRCAGGGLSVLGFFRSHTRKGLSLDSEDLSFFSARFRDPSHVALLVRPYATKASTAGFFIWENGSVQGESSLLEFPFRSSQLSPSHQGTSVIESTAPANPAVSPAAAAPSPAPAAPKPAVRAQIVPIASRREITLPTPPDHAEKPAPEAKAPETKPVENKANQKPPEQKQDRPVVKPAAPAPAAAAPVVSPAPSKDKPKEPEKPQVKAAAAPAPTVEKPKDDKAKDDKAKDEKAKAEKAKDEKAKDEKAKEAAKLKEQPSVAPEAAPARGKTMMYGAVAAAVLLLCTILFLYPGVLRHHGADTVTAPGLDTSPLALHVERTGTDILLTWNRDSASIQHAKNAVLTISDGDRHENYDMDLSQLRNGSIVYSPLTADVSFRMEVTGQQNAKTASESVRVLRTRPSPMPDGSQPPADTAAAKPNNGNGKPAATANAATPNAAAEETATQEPAAPTKAGSPAKPFNTESLGQRLRPATAAEVPLPAPPTLNNSPVVPTSAPNFGSTSVPPAPVAPPPAPAPAPTRTANANPPASTRTAPPASAGGQIQQAVVIYSKQPEYPKLARQMGVKGSVEVLATIGADGRVKAVKVEKGHPLLVKAATDAVMQWIYKPTLLNGTPVQNDTHITLNFLGDK